MTRNILLEGTLTAADTFTALATRGSETSPSLQLPSAWSKITRIIVAASVDMAAAGASVVILRLSGAAVQGTQDIVVAANGGQDPQAGSDTPPIIGLNLDIDDADIPVSGGDVINVQAAMTDSDLGTAQVVVALYGE